MTPATRDQKRGRVRSLDALRGIAAFVVVLWHLLHMQHDALAFVGAKPLYRLAELAGKEAVLIFFVLSGFVLFLSVESDRRFVYRAYLVKRVARIYLPFAVAILVSAALLGSIRPSPVPGLSGWFNGYAWSRWPTPEVVLGHLAMTDRTDWQTLDVVMWSLVHEMRISLIFPLLAVAVARDWRVACAGSLLVSMLGLALFQRLGHAPLNLLSTARYLWLFAVGAAMALKADVLRAWLGRQPAPRRLATWLLALALLGLPFEATENLTTPLGSILMVFLCFADAPADRVLASPLPEWLGRISYSLYLIHIPVLLAMAHLLHALVPMAVLVLLIVAAALLAAELMNRAVEQPAIALGRRAARRLGRAVREPPPPPPRVSTRRV